MPTTLEAMKAALNKAKEVAESYALIIKGKANYREAGGEGGTCGECRFFQPYIIGWDDATGAALYDRTKPSSCNLVEGEIEPLYVCDLFEAIGQPALESQFSMVKASSVDRSKLPQTAFLVESKYLPIRDESGKVNVGYLAAAHSIATTGKYRGVTPTFTLTESVKEGVVKLWKQWQATKDQGTALAAESIADLDYLEQGSLSQLPGTIVTQPTIIAQVFESTADCILQDYVWRTYAESAFDSTVLSGHVVKTVVESIDIASRTAVIIAIESGWSLNVGDTGLPRYYQKSAVRDFAEALRERPNIFAEHVTGTDVKSRYLKMNRPMTECVAIVVEENGVRQAWYEETNNGTGVAKAKVRFTNRQCGRETWEELLEDPKSVQFSVNARTFVNPKAVIETKPCESIEGVQVLYSLDNVGYAAAGGRVADVSASIDGYTEDLRTNSNGVIAQIEVCEGAYYTYNSLSDGSVVADIAASINPKHPKEDDCMFTFKSVAEALANGELLTAFKAHLKVDSMEADQTKLTAENVAFKEQLTTANNKVADLEENVRHAATRQLINAKVATVRKDEKDGGKGIPNFNVSESFILDALALRDDVLPDNYSTLSTEARGAFLNVESKINARIEDRVQMIKDAVEAVKPSTQKPSTTTRQAVESVSTGLESNDGDKKVVTETAESIQRAAFAKSFKAQY